MAKPGAVARAVCQSAPVSNGACASRIVSHAPVESNRIARIRDPGARTIRLKVSTPARSSSGFGIGTATRLNICKMPRARATGSAGSLPPINGVHSESSYTSVRRDRHQHVPPKCNASLRTWTLRPTSVIRSSGSDRRIALSTLSVVEDHIAAREQQRQLAKCFGVRLQWKSTCELGVRRIERVVLADQRGRLAVHAPVRQYAGTVHDNQAAYDLQINYAEADYVVPRRIYCDREGSLGRVDNLWRRLE